MREITKNGIKMTYPDEVAMAFNPFLCVLEGEDILFRAEARVTDGGGGEVGVAMAAAHGGRLYLDLREYVQAVFDGTPWGEVDYSAQASDAGTARAVSVEVKAYGFDSPLGETFTFSCMAVWGALAPGERFQDGERVVTWFRNYPFSIGIYAGGGTDVLYGFNGKRSALLTLGAKGIYNLVLGRGGECGGWLDVWEFSGSVGHGVFDKTFDTTFSYSINGKSERKIRVRLECPCYDQGVYLRWIDRHGFYCYYLFKRGEARRKVDAESEFQRDSPLAYDEPRGRMRGIGRRLGYSRADTLTIAAPLVDPPTFDFLQDLTTSPVVDMYMGVDSQGSAKWLSVAVAPGTYAKSGGALQDFILSVTLPDVPLQSL